jgi:hypothetical protein
VPAKTGRGAVSLWRQRSGCPPASTEAVIKALDGHARAKRYDHGYHMLLRDLEAKKVWSDTLDWIASGRSTPD